MERTERKNRRVVKRVNADPGFTRAFVPIRRDTAARKPASIHIDVARRRDVARLDQVLQALQAPSAPSNVVTQVYQPMYADGVAATGLGDFVRGCLCLTQLCAILQWPLRISLAAHPVARWLAYPSLPPRAPARVHRWAELNHTPALLAGGNEISHEPALGTGEMIRRFRDAVQEHGAELCAIAFPPMAHFAPHQKVGIVHALTPTRDIRLGVSAFIRSLPSPMFSVLHVRAGDDTFSCEMSQERIDAIITFITPFTPTMPCVLLTDSLALRRALCLRSTFHVFSDEPPAHTCSATADQLRTTVAELHLLSQAHNIRAFSVYTHGTGFSKWIALLHDIPYQCHLLPSHP